MHPNLALLGALKKLLKKKKFPTDRPNFFRNPTWGQHNNYFFFWPYTKINLNVYKFGIILKYCLEFLT